MWVTLTTNALHCPFDAIEVSLGNDPVSLVEPNPSLERRGIHIEVML